MVRAHTHTYTYAYIRMHRAIHLHKCIEYPQNARFAQGATWLVLQNTRKLPSPSDTSFQLATSNNPIPLSHKYVLMKSLPSLW
jgi:hypothetical protein